MPKLDQIEQLNSALNEFVRQYASRSELLNDSGNALAVSDTQAHILMLLLDSPQPLANNQLATTMELSRPAITKAIKELTKHAFLIAQPAKHDGRVMQYQLTPSGREVARQHHALHQATLAQLATVSAKYTSAQLATIEQFINEIATRAWMTAPTRNEKG